MRNPDRDNLPVPTYRCSKLVLSSGEYYLGNKLDHNILFVTYDDMVFGLGYNSKGCFGLGHNESIKSPQVIPELSHQKIHTFIIGYDFVLAMNTVKQIYSWGHNMWGQLGRDVTQKGSYVKPERISYFDNKYVQQISCGSHHCLALTSSGQVYGWGCNREGQIGYGDQMNDRISEPILIQFSNNPKIQNIYCHNWCSFAITCDGHVFSWGYNGSGGFGTVLRVKHKFDGQVFAVKRIKFNELDERETQKVLKEVMNLVKVKSQYVVKYYHSWREIGCLYIQMEFCSHSLKIILKLKPQIIHRDLKPENILIAHNVRNGRFLKLCDFGLATVHDKRIHYITKHKHTADVGDLRYQAPEVAQYIPEIIH
ncbi:unnamed protein product [Oppiella nova]|uniref:Protein kinase domain-containing protein n=1 Tax=Oppiella nova TaxID=334625 RepID=A0A7R9LJ91_9ACAR|nr:unnamed protein product [Oppiella nova]CAG2164163.1 unnamed protein product [Oppiella nova]